MSQSMSSIMTKSIKLWLLSTQITYKMQIHIYLLTKLTNTEMDAADTHIKSWF